MMNFVGLGYSREAFISHSIESSLLVKILDHIVQYSDLRLPRIIWKVVEFKQFKNCKESFRRFYYVVYTVYKEWVRKDWGRFAYVQ